MRLQKRLADWPSAPRWPRLPHTIRRCSPNFRATPLIVPAPCSYSRRISSYSSTLFLLGKTTSVFSFSWQKQSTGFAFRGGKSNHRSGPIQTSEIRRRVNRVNVAFPRSSTPRYGRIAATHSTRSNVACDGSGGDTSWLTIVSRLAV